MMKLFKITILASLIGLSTPVFASGSKVEQVVVFADRAQVTRRAKVVCRNTRAKIEITHLPARLDQRTLRAVAPEGVKLLGMSVHSKPVKESDNESVRLLDGELEKIDHQLAQLDDEAKLAVKQGASTEEYAQLLQTIISRALATPKFDGRKWTSAFDYVRGQLNDSDRVENELTFRRKALKRQRDVVSRRRAQYVSERQNTMMIVSATFDCGRSKILDLRLSYVVPGATWRPEYDFRVRLPKGRKSGQSNAELTVAAVIRQSTGEDWTDARIVLSTAQPRLGSKAPIPAPLFVRGHEVEEAKVLVQSQESRKTLRQGKSAHAQASSGAAFEDRGQSFALKLPKRVTVRADGRGYWMPIDSYKTEAEVLLTSVPKLRPFVYQMAKFHNPSQHPLLAGTVHVYRAGAYIGDVSMDYRGVGEPLEISLGIDEEFRIERNERHAEDRGAGFLSSDKHLERSYRITTHNQSQKPVTILLRENIPVSKIEDVRVEIEKKRTTAGYELDAYRGFLSWKLKLKSNQHKDIDLTYSVHLPESWIVR